MLKAALATPKPPVIRIGGRWLKASLMRSNPNQINP